MVTEKVNDMTVHFPNKIVNFSQLYNMLWWLEHEEKTIFVACKEDELNKHNNCMPDSKAEDVYPKPLNKLH